MASEKHADFVIVGGGTAGLVVANRLSENPKVQVTVLEAGEDLTADPRVTIPAMWTALIGSDADWQFRTVAQPGLKGRVISQPRGKALGGCSAINMEAFIAPSRAGFDAWAELGSPGWDWEGLVPYFKKSYTLNPPADEATRQYLGLDWIDDNTHGKDGPIQVSWPGVEEAPLAEAWTSTFRAMGKTTNADPFSGKSTGGYSSAATVDPVTKTRSHAGNAYGSALRKRPNVRVITGVTVHKLLFEKAEKGRAVAIGVQASVEGKLKNFTAAKEVILASGAIGSPQILELSGVGDKTRLDKHGIPVVVDLPGVGENLQDHLMTGISYEVVDGIATCDSLARQEPEALAQAQNLYFKHRAGPLSVGGSQSHAFMPIHGDISYDQLLATPPSRPEDAAHVNIVRSILECDAEADSSAWLMVLSQINLHQNQANPIYGQLLPGSFASLGCSQCHPFSRGSTHIVSEDPKASPDIDPRYFSHPADLEIMACHLQGTDALRRAPGLAKFFKEDGQRNHPDAFAIADLEAAKKYVRDTATTNYHMCGTTAMMPKEKGGVLNPRLMVYGTKNVRVIDASVFPLIPRGNILSSVYAVAEKAADIIKEDHGLREKRANPLFVRSGQVRKWLKTLCSPRLWRKS